MYAVGFLIYCLVSGFVSEVWNKIWWVINAGIFGYGIVSGSLNRSTLTNDVTNNELYLIIGCIAAFIVGMKVGKRYLAKQTSNVTITAE